ncbi:hypothetical protein WR25_24875 [Diploscapter pachys]|uniref:Nuclear receptor domain-containing protein n=1 Tax=Diploscapter pachys TaxID=2018661 RepID=A0A2A2L4P5_9BILA|nr:hypothetical protein WR25_24875 [Diploscapter pachys]
MSNFSMLPPPVDGIPQDLRCLVCADRAEGFHFGCLSCAACGAFFRRSISDQKVYYCLTRKCSVIYDPSKKGGCCRYCRFTKCLTVGMLPQEVRAKRSSAPAFLPLSGAVRDRARALAAAAAQQAQLQQQPGVDETIIERILHLRRELHNEPPMPMPNERTIFSSLRHALQEEFEIFRCLANGHSLIRELIFDNDSDILVCAHWCDLEPSVRDIFLMYFLHETLFCTARGGGIQLDRLILPNRSFVELNEHYISLFFMEDPTVLEPASLARLCSSPFSTLVQSCARTIQSAHLDETDSAILFYVSLSQSVAPMQRLPAAERSRHAMFAELAHSLEAVGVDFSVKIGNVMFLLESLLNAVTAMHEIISFVYVSGTIWKEVKNEEEVPVTTSCQSSHSS